MKYHPPAPCSSCSWPVRCSRCDAGKPMHVVDILPGLVRPALCNAVQFGYVQHFVSGDFLVDFHDALYSGLEGSDPNQLFPKSNPLGCFSS